MPAAHKRVNTQGPTAMRSPGVGKGAAAHPLASGDMRRGWSQMKVGFRHWLSSSSPTSLSSSRAVVRGRLHSTPRSTHCTAPASMQLSAPAAGQARRRGGTPRSARQQMQGCLHKALRHLPLVGAACSALFQAAVV